MVRTFDEQGRVINERCNCGASTLGDAPAQTAPNAPAIADFFGVPVKWVLIAGLVFLVLPYFLGSRR